MQTLSFTTIPEKYARYKSLINNEQIFKLYSNFKYLYFNYSIISSIEDDNGFITAKKYDIIKFLLDYLNKFKFIIYHFTDINDFTKKKLNLLFFPNNSSSVIDVIIFTEENCLIIEKIDKKLFEIVLNDLKQSKISVLNTNCTEMTDNLMKEEILNFCKYFLSDIKGNPFLTSTIVPISGYTDTNFIS